MVAQPARSLTRLLAPGVLAAALLVPELALAHGSTPEANGVFLRANAPAEVVLATNFGLIVSQDSGATWEWICEESFGSNAVNHYAQGPDGAFFAATFDGLFRTDGSACAFAAAKGDLVGHNVLDVAPDPADATRAFALGRPVDGDGNSGPVALFGSSDGGRTWTRLPGLPASPTTPLLTRLKVSPDGTRLYVWGSSLADDTLGPNIFQRALDAATFTAANPAGLLAQEITDLVIDPADARRVLFVATGPAEDRLLDSAAGGADPVERLRVADRLRGIAFGPDKRVWVGGQQSRTLHQSDDGGMSFAPSDGGPHYGCLGARGDTLWACGDWRGKPLGDGYALASARAGSFTAALAFDDVSKHAATCLGNRCAPTAEWLCTFACDTGDGGLFSPERRESVPAERPDGPMNDASVSDAGGDAHGATGGGGCGCAIPASPPATGVALALALFTALAFAIVMRRR